MLFRSKTCLMVSDDAYKQYTDLQQQREQINTETREQQEAAARKRAKEVQKEAEAPDSKLSPEVRRIIKTGENYIQKIHACNDAIPGAEISAKISRMEILVDRIFDRVEQNPDSVSDIGVLPSDDGQASGGVSGSGCPAGTGGEHHFLEAGDRKDAGYAECGI